MKKLVKVLRQMTMLCNLSKIRAIKKENPTILIVMKLMKNMKHIKIKPLARVTKRQSNHRDWVDSLKTLQEAEINYCIEIS
jgi:hypothetical protein